MERKGHREGKRQAGAGGEEEVSPTSVLPSVTPRELGMPPRANEHGRAGSLLALCGAGRALACQLVRGQEQRGPCPRWGDSIEGAESTVWRRPAPRRGCEDPRASGRPAGWLLEPPQRCPRPAALVVPGSSREATLAAFPAFPSVVFALTSVSLGVVGAGTAPQSPWRQAGCANVWGQVGGGPEWPLPPAAGRGGLSPQRHW